MIKIIDLIEWYKQFDLSKEYDFEDFKSLLLYTVRAGSLLSLPSKVNILAIESIMKDYHVCGNHKWPIIVDKIMSLLDKEVASGLIDPKKEID